MAEGAPLLRVYTLTRIEGSNPFLSARGLIITIQNNALWAHEVLDHDLVPTGGDDESSLSISYRSCAKKGRREQILHQTSKI